MAVTLGEGFLAAALLAGVGLCLHGLYCYRRWTEPGVGPFAAVTVVLGAGGIGGAVVALLFGRATPEGVVPLWSNVALTGWVLAMVPWVLFAFEYTGRYERIRWRTRAAIAFPVVGAMSLLILQGIAVPATILTQLFGSVALLYTFALVAVGSYLLLRTTYNYGHLSLFQGASLTLSGVAPLVLLNSVGTIGSDVGNTVVFGLYALAFVTPFLGFVLAVFRYDMFDSTPAAGTIGERAIPRETDDLVVVVDRDQRVIKLNETAAETLGVDRTAPLGNPLANLLGRSVEELRDLETVELTTAVGTRKFDPQVTSFTDQHGRRLGSLLSLRDVTDRELRKQRLEVFNRVLRHNLRNRIDVIKSNAAAVAEETDTDHAAAIQKSADGLVSLSSKARATDELVSRPTQAAPGNLAEMVRDLVDAEEVRLDVPDVAPLVTDWDALRWTVESAIENAVEHAESAVTVSVEPTDDGYAVVVADDGPGIPESELASLDAETETSLQHGTGLGLWQLKWGVTKLHGDLDFDTADGTTVRITVPDRGNEQNEPSE
jgi:signal transduction histidine kinase